MPSEYPELESRVAATTRELRDRFKPYGVTLFVFGYDSPEIAYCSTGNRFDMMTTLVEFLGRMDPEFLRSAIARWEVQKQYGPEGSS